MLIALHDKLTHEITCGESTNYMYFTFVWVSWIVPTTRHAASLPKRIPKDRS